MSDDLDPEMMEAFAEEVGQIKDELAPVVAQLKSNPNQPKHFEKFGQLIDRIYGTAATLGLTEVAEYTKMLKSICYKCSQSNNTYAQNQVKDLLVICMLQFDRIKASGKDPKALRQVRSTLYQERTKAESLAKKIFRNIRRSSVAA